MTRYGDDWEQRHAERLRRPTTDEARAALLGELEADGWDMALVTPMLDALIAAVRAEGSGMYWLGKAEGRAAVRAETLVVACSPACQDALDRYGRREPLDVDQLARAMDNMAREQHDPEHGRFRSMDDDAILATLTRRDAERLAAEYARLEAADKT